MFFCLVRNVSERKGSETIIICLFLHFKITLSHTGEAVAEEDAVWPRAAVEFDSGSHQTSSEEASLAFSHTSLTAGSRGRALPLVHGSHGAHPPGGSGAAKGEGRGVLLNVGRHSPLEVVRSWKKSVLEIIRWPLLERDVIPVTFWGAE